MDADPIVWIIIGVAGSGKTLIGRRLAAQLACDFLEGDRCHPIRNVAKMLAQQPLTDIDRAEWLQAIVVDIQRAIGAPDSASLRIRLSGFRRIDWPYNLPNYSGSFPHNFLKFKFLPLNVKNKHRKPHEWQG